MLLYFQFYLLPQFTITLPQYRVEELIWVRCKLQFYKAKRPVSIFNFVYRKFIKFLRSYLYKEMKKIPKELFWFSKACGFLSTMLETFLLGGRFLLEIRVAEVT